ncbi:RanGap [Drosophila busckii]|uniref:RanGap n=1 Tax=Drosophila busckii TaxID=30019 RepID=A0A0M3QTU1_DROBS|nr:ran GTPase-activating protein [Drosophila busckii]ALC39503.1 RanGap [Drosophila busckii]
MAMANFSFVSMAAQAPKESGISFQNKAATWDNAEQAKDVVDALNRESTVHYLNLDGNTLGVDAAKAIGEALKRHPEFRKALWKNLFTRRLKSEIPLALKHLGAGLIAAKAKLTVLDLSDNALGPNGMTGLEDFLRSPVCYSLQELYLNNCGLGPEGGCMLSKAMLDLHANAKAAGTPLQLRIFVAGRNRLENVGATAISKIFKTLQTLEEICMPQNSIYHKGVAALAEGLKLNPHLRVLNLNDNTLTCKGASEIAAVFEHTPHLREINFGDCIIKTDGAYLFAEALEQHHKQLEVLDLGFNEINHDGGLMLVTAVVNKPNLRLLNLDGNCFGQKGCELIIAEMEKTANPAALQPFEEDDSEDEAEKASDDEENSEEDDAETVEYGEDDYEQDGGDSKDYDPNDTTEEVDEEDDEYADENAAEDTAYVTTRAFNTMNINETTSAKSDDTIANAQNDNLNISAEDFVLGKEPCTLQQFGTLNGDNKLHKLMSVIDQFDNDNHLLLLVFTTLKCAHHSKSSKAALDLAVSLYKTTFEYAIKTKQEQRVLDYVLKQLCILRSEEPFKSPYDMTNCRYALREVISLSDFANDNIKNTLKVCLDQLDA